MNKAGEIKCIPKASVRSTVDSAWYCDERLEQVLVGEMHDMDTCMKGTLVPRSELAEKIGPFATSFRFPITKVIIRSRFCPLEDAFYKVIDGEQSDRCSPWFESPDGLEHALTLKLKGNLPSNADSNMARNFRQLRDETARFEMIRPDASRPDIGPFFTEEACGPRMGKRHLIRG